MSAEDDKRKAPVLTTVNEDAVRTWAKRFEGYVKRGGKRRARECVDDDVLDAVSLFGVEVKAGGDTPAEQRDDDERFLRALRAIYAAPDKDAARAELAAVVMSAEFTTDTVSEFVLEFTKAMKAHAAGATELGEENVRDIFLEAIQVKVIRKRVKGSSPATWQEAARDLMQRVRDHEAKAKEVALLAAATRRVPRRVNVKLQAARSADAEESPSSGFAPRGGDMAAPEGSADEKKDKTTNRKCYRCGETGHMARDCKLSEQEGRDRLRAEAGSTRETRADTAEKRSLIKCHHCGSDKHYTSQCPAKEFPKSGQVLAMRLEPGGRNKTTARSSKCTTKEKLSRLPGTSGITDDAGRRWKVVDEDFDDDSSDSDAY